VTGNRFPSTGLLAWAGRVDNVGRSHRSLGEFVLELVCRTCCTPLEVVHSCLRVPFSVMMGNQGSVLSIQQAGLGKNS